MKTNYHFSNGYCKVTIGENQKNFEMKGDSPNDFKELHKQIKEWHDELEMFKKTFIGINDYNGNPIKEGDILDVDCRGVGGSFEDGIYYVKYLLPDAAFMLVQMDNMHSIPFNECYTYKIIGSIYELERDAPTDKEERNGNG